MTSQTNRGSSNDAAANRRLGLILFGIFAVLTVFAALYIAFRPRG